MPRRISDSRYEKYLRDKSIEDSKKFEEKIDTLFNPDVPVPSVNRFVHRDDPSTSHEVAKSSPIKRDSERHRLLIQFAFHRSLTDQEAGELAGVTGEYDDRRNCSILRTAGYIEHNGERGLSKRGKPAMKSSITDKGRAQLERINAINESIERLRKEASGQ